MTDAELTETWAALEPSSQQRQRIQRRLQADLAAHDTPLFLEWLTALRLAPLPTLGLAAASAVALLAGPLAWLAVGLG